MVNYFYFTDAISLRCSLTVISSNNVFYCKQKNSKIFKLLNCSCSTLWNCAYFLRTETNRTTSYLVHVFFDTAAQNVGIAAVRRVHACEHVRYSSLSVAMQEIETKQK